MSVEENDQHSITVRLHVVDDMEITQEESLDFDLSISKDGSVAELKTILESEYLIPEDTTIYDINVRQGANGSNLPDSHIITEKFLHVICSFRTTHTDQTVPAAVNTETTSTVNPEATDFSPRFIFIPRTSQLFGNLTPLPNTTNNSGQPAQTQQTQAQTQQQHSFLLPSQANNRNLDMMRNLFTDPNALRQFMSSPVMRSILSNPDLISNIINSNPQMRELRERNLDLNRIFNDPQLLRESVEALQNPSLMQEMISNTDRALNNIDAAPGGFNALRNVYESIQEPIWHATAAAAYGTSDNTVKSYDLKTDESPSSDPIPSPWSVRPKANLQQKFTSRVVASGVAQKHRNFYRALYQKSQALKAESKADVSNNNNHAIDNESNQPVDENES